MEDENWLPWLKLLALPGNHFPPSLSTVERHSTLAGIPISLRRKVTISLVILLKGGLMTGWLSSGCNQYLSLKQLLWLGRLGSLLLMGMVRTLHMPLLNFVWNTTSFSFAFHRTLLTSYSL